MTSPRTKSGFFLALCAAAALAACSKGNNNASDTAGMTAVPSGTNAGDSASAMSGGGNGSMGSSGSMSSTSADSMRRDSTTRGSSTGTAPRP